MLCQILHDLLMLLLITDKANRMETECLCRRNILRAVVNEQAFLRFQAIPIQQPLKALRRRLDDLFLP